MLPRRSDMVKRPPLLSFARPQDHAPMANSEFLPPEPPALSSERGIVQMGAAGCGLAAVAALIGLPDSGESLTPIRAGLAALGMLLSGCALTMRYRWPVSWLLAAGTCGLATVGFPASWDTFRLVAGVFAVVSLFGAIFTALPFVGRMWLGSVLVLIHFLGIFTAVTTPNPTPWLTRYLSVLVYRPYLQFAYLGNAYQFYSPDPGPASHLWFCIYYEPKKNDPVKMEVLQQNADGTPVLDRDKQPLYKLMTDARGELTGEPIYDEAGNYIFTEQKDRSGNVLKRPVNVGDEQAPDYLLQTRWVKIPKRHRDFKDPLGQSYYRRLSLTEQVAHFTPLTQYPTPIVTAMSNKRAAVASVVPLDMNEWPMPVQCRIPTHDATEYILPSYVRFLARDNATADRPIRAIKAYWVMHSITAPENFITMKYKGEELGVDMNNPITYLPYYLGEFDAQGKLINPSDPLLYWLIPIRRNPTAHAQDYRKHPESLADYKRLYEDFVYKHAGSHHMEGEFAK